MLTVLIHVAGTRSSLVPIMAVVVVVVAIFVEFVLLLLSRFVAGVEFLVEIAVTTAVVRSLLNDYLIES